MSDGAATLENTGGVDLPHDGDSLFATLMDVMVSEENEKEIQEYLDKNDFFGVPREEVHFLCQGSLPLLDEKENPLIENSLLQRGPDGNGRVFASLYESDLSITLKQKGLEALSILPIDNPLMDPYLPSLFHPVLIERKEAAILAIERKTTEEKTGILYLEKGNPHVVEYSEARSSIKEALAPDGTLLFRWANISVLCIPLAAIEKLAQWPLILHKARKERNKRTIYKQEYFLFDVFPALSSFSLVGIDRSRWFSPIKGRTGDDSLEQASHAFEKLQEAQAEKAPHLLSQGKSPSDIDPAILYGIEP